MTTAATSTVVDQTTDAAFRTWVAEVITQLLAVGLTQTADTGQINTTTVTRAAGSTAAGYTIWRFNDTLQATAPIYIKLEFGSGSSNTVPAMWITVGQGSNGSGTLTGTLTTRCSCGSGTALSSTITSYTSRFVYNSTYGFLAVVMKIGSIGANVAWGGFIVVRSCDSTGAATGDSVGIITNSFSASPVGFSGTQAPSSQFYSWVTSAVYPPALNSNTANTCCFFPFLPTSTTVSGNQQVMPAFHATPAIQFSNTWGLCNMNEVAVGSTFTAQVVGSTTLTYISVGGFHGVNTFLFNGAGSAQGPAGSPPISAYILWQ